MIYPDSDDVVSPLGDGSDGVYDRVELKYNRQGEVKERKDQNGTVHAFDRDKLGRQTHDRIKHGYDRASNRTYRGNTVSKAQGTPVKLDELYGYDGLYQRN